MRVFLVLFAAVLASRIPVLNRSVLDWDESLYFLMAQAWQHGHLPYTVIWDNKPVGIYAIFAVFQMVVPGVLAMRLATVCFVAVLAFAVFRITEVLAASRGAAWVAAGALVLGSLSNDGLSANTELFMATFTAYAVLAALTTASGLLVGVLLGAAFMVKYVAVFEAPVVFLLLLWRLRDWRAGLFCVLGAGLPLAAVMALYALAGDFALWLDCSVLSNFRRVAAPVTDAALRYALHIELWRWGTLYVGGLGMAGVAVWRRGFPEVFLAAWLLGGLAGVAASKSFYDHYFLQVLPVLCVSLGIWFARLPSGWPVRAGFVVAALALPALAAQTALRDAAGPDVPRLVAADLLRGGLRDGGLRGGSLYVFDSQPILYALTGAPPPTRYVLPSELIGWLLPKVAGVDPVAEVARILATRPEFIVRRDPAPAHMNAAVYAEADAALAAHYALWRKLPGADIYKRK